MILEVGMNFGVEISLYTETDFLKIKETLTRIGIASKDNTLWQSCHILHKRGKYYIVHFKEMFFLDGKQSDLTDEDLDRRDAVVTLLKKWGLLEVVEPGFESIEMHGIKVVKFSDKKNWSLKSKYTIGKR